MRCDGPRRAIRAIVACSLVGLGAAACDLGHECTLAACGPSVIVQIEGLGDAELRSALLQVGDAEPFELDCWSNTECHSRQAADDFTPGTFTVTIEAGDTTHSRTFSPSYETTYPNGESCGPRCRATEVTFTVDE